MVALDGACELLSRDMISAHVLVCTAISILRVLANKHTGFSIYETLWDVTDEIGDKRKLNNAYNFFKHADRDNDCILDFDRKLTEHWIYLAFIDLDRLKKNQPDKPHYIIKPADHTLFTVGQYVAKYRADPCSLAHLDRILKDDDTESREAARKHIKNWLLNRTNIVENPKHTGNE